MKLEGRYDPKEAEPRIQKFWTASKIFKFDPEAEGKIFSIDTPPPTVSGNLHIGHVMHYSQFEFVARQKRMLGYNVFFPFGFDNNGLATEILTEKTKKIVAERVGRDEFNKRVADVSADFVKVYQDVWTKMGISCDWSLCYQTIDLPVQKISQLSFLELYENGHLERKEKPVIWCTKCRTAIAQVETEDKQFSSQLVYIELETDSKGKLTIATTRPELMPACVGISVHPDDKRYKKFIGKKAKLPLFDREVPIIADEEVDMEYGTGVVYYCTYGGAECVEWMERHPEIKPIPILSKAGKLLEKADKYADMKVLDARKAIIADLEEKGVLKDKKDITHMVNTHERCGTPIEFILAKQWFVKYLDPKLIKVFLKLGHKIKWYPAHMRIRLDNWINGLKWDWCISRQRFHGVPFPVWYCKKCGKIKLAGRNELPVDPLDRNPETKCGCGSPDFEPERDVLDTWMTSSMTPFINAKWGEEDNLMKKIYPMDLRPQAHDIITFWGFNTIVKGYFHTKGIPFKNIMISGHGLDKNGKKMSKSKGNVVDPFKMLEKYSADAIRYWAGSARLGDDLPFQEKDLATGQKLVTKLWNASKFVQMNLEKGVPSKVPKLKILDKWILSKLYKLIDNVTKGFEVYEYSKAKTDTEIFFWKDFCDNYLEMVKYRLYNKDDPAARWTLYTVLLGTLKLFAPIMPHITEEIYQKMFAKGKSIHVLEWPKPGKVDAKALELGGVAKRIIAALRQWKQSQKMALNAEIDVLVLECEPGYKKEINLILDDIKGTMKIKEIKFGKAENEIQEGLKFSII